MDTIQLVLNEEEKEFLVDLLELELKHRMVEEHRTKVRAFRDRIERAEDILQGLLSKLNKAPVPV